MKSGLKYITVIPILVDSVILMKNIIGLSKDFYLKENLLRGLRETLLSTYKSLLIFIPGIFLFSRYYRTD